MARQQSTISAALTTYYRQLDQREIAEERLRLTRERITELETLLSSNQLIPSQGVARYSPMPSGQGTTSDPTTRIVAAYEREFEHYADECTRLRLRETGLSQQIAEIRDQGAVITKALSYVTAIDAQILEDKYRFGKSNVQIAIEVELDERTVRNHLDALNIEFPKLVEGLQSLSIIPEISSSEYASKYHRKHADQDSALSGQIALSYK